MRSSKLKVSCLPCPRGRFSLGGGLLMDGSSGDWSRHRSNLGSICFHCVIVWRSCVFGIIVGVSREVHKGSSLKTIKKHMFLTSTNSECEKDGATLQALARRIKNFVPVSFKRCKLGLGWRCKAYLRSACELLGSGNKSWHLEPELARSTVACCLIKNS